MGSILAAGLALTLAISYYVLARTMLLEHMWSGMVPSEFGFGFEDSDHSYTL